MIKTTVQIDGMSCGMCEAHVQDEIRKVFPKAKKVSASKGKKEATFLTEEEVDLTALEKAIEGIGYHYLGASSESYEKKKRFGRG